MATPIVLDDDAIATIECPRNVSVPRTKCVKIVPQLTAVTTLLLHITFGHYVAIYGLKCKSNDWDSGTMPWSPDIECSVNRKFKL